MKRILFSKLTHSFSINSQLAVPSPKCSITEHACRVRVKYFWRSSNNSEVDYYWRCDIDTIINLNIQRSIRNIKFICVFGEKDYIVSYILFVVQNNKIVHLEWLQDTLHIMLASIQMLGNNHFWAEAPRLIWSALQKNRQSFQSHFKILHKFCF